MYVYFPEKALLSRSKRKSFERAHKGKKNNNNKEKQIKDIRGWSFQDFLTRIATDFDGQSQDHQNKKKLA